MKSERQRSNRGLPTALGAIALIAYGYAFIYEKPGSVSAVGIIALAMGTVCLLFVFSYFAVRWYQGRRSTAQTFNGDRPGT